MKKNAEARKKVVDDYNALKKEYQESFEIDESKIPAYWGKILVEEGIIDFTTDQKVDIKKEAEKIVSERIKS